MAEYTTTRLGLKRWSSGSDTPSRSDFDLAHGDLATLVAGWLPEDVAANRPSASAANARFLFRASDSGQLSYSTGSTWIDIPSDGDVSSIVGTAVSTVHEGRSDPHTGYLHEPAHSAGLHSGLGIAHPSLAGRGDDDHPQFPLVSGARGFTDPVPGQRPVTGVHLATKSYVDERSAIGTVMFTVAGTAPDGWLLCRGQTVDKADHPELFNVIGTAYGPFSTGTFSLPDLRQRLPLGKAASGTGSSLGNWGGSIEHAHSNPNTNDGGNHRHGRPNTGTAPSHAHGDSFYVGDDTSNGDGSGPGFIGGGHRHTLIGALNTAGSHYHTTGYTYYSSTGHTHSQGDTGVGGAPPYLVLNAIIKAS